MAKNLVLICGTSASGKSASLMGLTGGVMYLNCEAGKFLPFAHKFQEHVITDPYQVYEGFEYAETDDSIDTIVIDSSTFLMDMFESVYVIGSANTMQGWQDYQQFFKNLMQQYVAKSTKNVIFTAHVLVEYNEDSMANEVKVPVKGALKNNGIEAFFSVVVAAKRMETKKLEGYDNPRLVITEDEEDLGFKYVYQTRLTKQTMNERVRGPMGMFSRKESFMDNNAQKLIEHLEEYYAE